MSKNLLIAFSIGIAAVAIAAVGIVYMQRGAHIQLPGKILKVRTAPLDEGSSVAVLDFRVTNPADYPFQVRTVTVILEDAAGKQTDGETISDTDATRMFEELPLLGHKYNPSLIMRDRVAPHTTEDRMISARFEVPEAKLDARKRFVLRVEEVDGTIAEIPER